VVSESTKSHRYVNSMYYVIWYSVITSASGLREILGTPEVASDIRWMHRDDIVEELRQSKGPAQRTLAAFGVEVPRTFRTVTPLRLGRLKGTLVAADGWRGAIGLYRSMLREGSELRALAETPGLTVLAVGAGGGPFTAGTMSQATSSEISSVQLDGVGHYAAMEAPRNWPRPSSASSTASTPATDPEPPNVGIPGGRHSTLIGSGGGGCPGVIRGRAP
jgi:hypothetical protein